MPSINEHAQRRLVWIALSDLFLDTDTSEFRDHTIEVLANSPYSLEQLDQILLLEVYPACHWNLSSVTGVWDGFGIDFLEQKIARGVSWPFKLWAKTIGRYRVNRYLDWQEIKNSVQASRCSN